MNVGKTIKWLRAAAGLNQKQFAERIHVSASFLSLIENGEREPNLSLLKTISRELGVPVGALFFNSDDKPENLDDVQLSGYGKIQDLLGDLIKHMLTNSKARETNSNGKVTID